MQLQKRRLSPRRRTLASNGMHPSPFDLAVEAASASEKTRLREIRLRLNVPADSPEWGMYLILVTPILEFEAQITENRQNANVEMTRATNEALAKIAAVAGSVEQTIAKTVRTEVASALQAVPRADYKPERWRWPLTVAVVAGGLLLLAGGSFSGAVAQRTLDVTQRLQPSRAMIHVPWVLWAQATIATWPVLPFVVATAILLVLTMVLGVRKSGPVYRKIFP